jgi:anti-sigma regulatory factor (Ser/Thr protein kinase)
VGAPGGPHRHLILAAGEGAPNSVRHGGGYGLWLANQVCDLVQVRSSPAGTTVRLHVRAVAA